MAAGSKHRKYLVFVVVSLALFMSSVDSTIVATALPAIERSLRADLNWAGWVITAYQLMTLRIMPLMGRISDEWGRKRIFMACVAVFTVSSMLCALSPNIYFLIIFRFLQALGGGEFPALGDGDRRGSFPGKPGSGHRVVHQHLPPGRHYRARPGWLDPGCRRVEGHFSGQCSHRLPGAPVIAIFTGNGSSIPPHPGGLSRGRLFRRHDAQCHVLYDPPGGSNLGLLRHGAAGFGRS